ncbi:MAG: C1 family peptidase [candidate division KSB1 bacterium]|nr:C1 family peptidase [candidate division KSB1 bacterium]
MNSLTLRFCLFLLFTTAVLYAGVQPGLSETDIQTMQRSLQQSDANKALLNAVSNNDIKDLVLNRERVNQHNDAFNVTTDAKGITDQQSTGRCWLFAALNIMRPVVMDSFNLDKFKFSPSYLFFWDKLEKSNYFLDTIIETRDRPIDDRELQAILDAPAPDGGWWNYAVNLIEKYGAVPQEVMQETQNTSNSRMLNKTLGTLLRRYAAELRSMPDSETHLRKRKQEMLQDCYRLVALHFGTPPRSFTWRVRNKADSLITGTFTPKEFYRHAVNLDLSDYVTLADYPAYPSRNHYAINFCTNLTGSDDMEFINVSPEILKQAALQSLLNKEPVWFAADAGWQMERDHGIMADDIYDYESLFDISLDMSKANRIHYGVSVANHAMVFIAADTLNGKVHKWRVENSWGTDRGDSGYWTLYDNWFDPYVFNLIINKKYLSDKELALFVKPVQRIPAWDPLRSAFLK